MSVLWVSFFSYTNGYGHLKFDTEWANVLNIFMEWVYTR